MKGENAVGGREAGQGLTNGIKEIFGSNGHFSSRISAVSHSSCCSYYAVYVPLGRPAVLASITRSLMAPVTETSSFVTAEEERKLGYSENFMAFNARKAL